MRLSHWVASALTLVLLAAPARAGLVIIPTFDSSITGDPNAAAIEGTINTAIGIYQAKFSDPITVHINFQEMPTGTVFDLQHPGVGIETDLAPDPLLDPGFLHRLPLDAAAECPIRRPRLRECGLGCRAEQLGGPIQTIELDEDRTGLLGAAPPHHRKGAFKAAATQIGRHPDRGFEAHRVWSLLKGGTPRARIQYPSA